MAIFKEAMQYYVHSYKESALNITNNIGINVRFLEAVIPNCNKHKIANLTKEDIEDLCFQHVWLENNYQQILSQQLANLIFATAITMGIKIANNFLKQTVSLFKNYNSIRSSDCNHDEILSIIEELNFINSDLEDKIIEVYKLYQQNHSMNIIVHRVYKTKYLKDFILK